MVVEKDDPAATTEWPSFPLEIREVDISGFEVTIIIAVHNAAEALERCLEALVRNTTSDAALLIVDDASTDERIPAILEKVQSFTRARVERHSHNMGFAKTINRWVPSIEGSVVILNSDTQVGPRWLENMKLALLQRDSIGTVTALSNNAGLYSVPRQNVANYLPADRNVDAAARLVSFSARPFYPSVGIGNGFCMLIRRQCYDEVDGFDIENFADGYGEESDFCIRSARVGWEHVIDDRTYVFHEREASFGERAKSLKSIAAGKLRAFPEYGGVVLDLAFRADLQRVRHKVREAFDRNDFKAKPRILFTIAVKAGGTYQTNADLMTQICSMYDVFLLHCDGRRLQISRYSGGQSLVLDEHELQLPITAVRHVSSEYNSVVYRWLYRYSFEVVHIRHLGWHSIDLPFVCKSLDIPTVFSLHDYYMVCPNTKLVDEERVVCNGRCTPSLGECSVELWGSSAIPNLKHKFVNLWRSRSLKSLLACDCLVVASNSAKEIISRWFHVKDEQLILIPHGRNFPVYRTPADYQLTDGVARILVAGELTAAKGCHLLAEVARILLPKRIEFHILGSLHSEIRSSNLIMHGAYSRENFVTLASEINPAFGFIPSIWPETFCHVLSEMWAAGLPVLAVDIGAIGERMREHGGGWLLAQADPGLAAGAITAILQEPGEILRCGDEIRLWQRRSRAEFTLENMADRYIDLYQQIIQRRRSFS